MFLKLSHFRENKATNKMQYSGIFGLRRYTRFRDKKRPHSKTFWQFVALTQASLRPKHLKIGNRSQLSISHSSFLKSKAKRNEYN